MIDGTCFYSGISSQCTKNPQKIVIQEFIKASSSQNR